MSATIQISQFCNALCNSFKITKNSLYRLSSFNIIRDIFRHQMKMFESFINKTWNFPIFIYSTAFKFKYCFTTTFN